jgi:hypothetical protein
VEAIPGVRMPSKLKHPSGDAHGSTPPRQSCGHAECLAFLRGKAAR